MANVNYNPNARYDCGPNAAGCGRASVQSVLVTQLGDLDEPGLESDGVLAHSTLRVGLNAAGVARVDTSASAVENITTSFNNAGPNAAGSNRCFTDIAN